MIKKTENFQNSENKFQDYMILSLIFIGVISFGYFVYLFEPSMLLFINTLFLTLLYFIIQGSNFMDRFFNDRNFAINFITFIILTILEIHLIYKLYLIKITQNDSD
jgi:hypothetical protein